MNDQELAGLPAEVQLADANARKMARTLPPDQRAVFEALIDGILDLTRQKLDLARENAELRTINAALETAERRCERAEAELAALKGFARDVMQAWPEGGIDGGELQDIALRHGLLEPSVPTQEERDEWGLCDGDDWYRRTALLSVGGDA